MSRTAGDRSTGLLEVLRGAWVQRHSAGLPRVRQRDVLGLRMNLRQIIEVLEMASVRCDCRIAKPLTAQIRRRPASPAE
jgi:hypothetical protein